MLNKGEKLDFARLEFPDVTDIEITFGGYPQEWFSNVLAQEEDRQWSQKAGLLFFKGGEIPINKKLPSEYRSKGIRVLECVLGSCKPKHEHKEHVAGLILRSICS